MGSRAAEAASTCVSSRAFARGHAWMDLHCAAIAAVACRARLRAAAGAPEASPLLSAARGVSADALFPPPSERLVRAAVAALSSAVATPAVRTAAAADGSLAAPVGDAASLTASLSRPARAEVFAVIAAAAAAAGGAAGGSDRASAAAAVLGRSVEARRAAAADVATAGADADAAGRAAALVHGSACHAAADVIGSVAGRAERSDAPVRASLWAVVGPCLPALAAVGAAACTPGRFTCKAGTAEPKASALGLSAACCSAVFRSLRAFRDRCPAAGAVAVVTPPRPAVGGAVAALAAASRVPPGGGARSGALARGGSGGALLRWWVRLVGAALGRPDTAGASPEGAWALPSELTGPLGDAAAGPASDGPACVSLAMALQEALGGLSSCCRRCAGHSSSRASTCTCPPNV